MNNEIFNLNLYEINLKKLEVMSKLEEDWDGYGASPFSETVIEHTRKLLSVLKEHQPDVFPTRYGDTQLEWYGKNEMFLKITITDEDNHILCSVFSTDSDNVDWDKNDCYFNSFEYDEDKLVQIVSDFYNNTLIPNHSQLVQQQKENEIHE